MSHILGTGTRHHRNTQNEQTCCAGGTQNAGELGRVPLGIATANSKAMVIHAVS